MDWINIGLLFLAILLGRVMAIRQTPSLTLVLITLGIIIGLGLYGYRLNLVQAISLSISYLFAYILQKVFLERPSALISSSFEDKINELASLVTAICKRDDTSNEEVLDTLRAVAEQHGSTKVRFAELYNHLLVRGRDAKGNELTDIYIVAIADTILTLIGEDTKPMALRATLDSKINEGDLRFLEKQRNQVNRAKINQDTLRNALSQSFGTKTTWRMTGHPCWEVCRITDLEVWAREERNRRDSTLLSNEDGRTSVPTTPKIIRKMEISPGHVNQPHQISSTWHNQPTTEFSEKNNPMKPFTGPMSKQTKSIMLAAGILLMLPGMMIALANLCIFPFAILSSPREALGIGTASFVFLMLTLGAGGVVAWYSVQSLRGKPSRTLRLPHVWIIAGIFGLSIFIGIVSRTNNIIAAFLFPPTLLITAAIPPILAVSWFSQPRADGLTFRRAMVAFAGGATVSVLIALALEIILPLIVVSLVFNLSNLALRSVQDLLTDLAGQQIARAITNPGFILAFIQLAIIAPIAEEIAKPLVTLPLIGRLTRRDAFLVAAMAGAGFAALENVIYTSFGAYLWSGILILRAIGGAIHPLGAGLVGLSWRDVLNGERDAWRNGLARFGIAVGMHALWNGGTLIVITLAGAQFFGTLPSTVNILGLSAAGTTLAMLIVLGLAALWLGRTVAQRTLSPLERESETETQFVLSDRAIAIWALACLVAVVPIGVTALRLLLR